MNLFQRARCSCIRKPIKSLVMLFIVCIISVLLLSGMASRSATIAAKDSTRQAIGAGFLLENNPENRSQRIDEASQIIAEENSDGQGSYGGYHQKKITVNGTEMWQSWTDHSFESLKLEDIKKIAAVEGIADYNITTVPTAVKPSNFIRIENSDQDQSNDEQGVALIGNRDMAMNDNVLSGNVSITEGRMTTANDENVCVISEDLAEKNQLHVGDYLTFHSVELETAVQQAKIVGIYQVKEKMHPYMSGDTYRSENIIFTDLHFPEKVEQDDPLYESAYFKVEDVDDYDIVKETIKKTDIDWQRYDLIDNNGHLDTMAANFNDLENISSALIGIIAGVSFLTLCLIFIFWIKNRIREVGIFLALGIAKGKILLQFLLEALMVSIFALALSFLIAPEIADLAANYLVSEQTHQTALEEENDSAFVSTDYQAPQLTVENVETVITPLMMFIDSAGIGILIVLSTGVAGIWIMRKKPKDILNDRS